MKRFSYLLFVILTGVSSRGTAQPPKEVVKIPVNLQSFIPKGYVALSLTHGDLNKDVYTDVVLVLYKMGEEKSSDVNEHPESRPLLLLLGQPGKTYKLAARSDNAVYCVDCGGMMGDPFTGVTVKSGYFSVEHYGGSGWRWTRIVTFKYNPAEKQWFLFKDGGDSFHATDPEKVKTKVNTVKDFGKVPFERFNIYKEKS